MILNVPEAFASQLKSQRPNDWQEIVNALQTNSPTSIRINPAKTFSHSFAEQIPWCDHGYYLSERPSFTLDPAFHAGAYYVQEASSMFLEQAIKQSVDLNESVNVLDLCAAPGGKSTHILSLIHRDSLLVANEVIRSRASILSENIQKWGHGNVVVTNNDPENFLRLSGFFDLLIVDAPCSGEGLFRKDASAMQEWSRANVALCSKRQQRILHDVWPALKENGILMYCTCTFNEFENEENLLWLQQEHEVEFMDLRALENWGVEKVTKGSAIGYHFYPNKVKGEGFFLSVIRKKDATSSFKIRGSNKGSLSAPKKIQGQLSDWIKNPEGKSFLQHEDFIYTIPKNKTDEYYAIHQNLKIVSAGNRLVTAKHDKLIPEHALALSIDLNRIFPTLELDRENALKYLRKDVLPYSGNQKGFALVMHNSLPLGWVNLLNTRLNNLYPAEWRIRMAGQ